MTKLIEVIKNNAKTIQEKNTAELLKAIRGGIGSSGWVRLGWKKSF